MTSNRNRWGRGLSATVAAMTLLVAVTAAGAESGAITYRVVSSAKITKVSYYLASYKGSETVFFEVGIKNVSDQPKRFKVLVDIPDGPSAAYYYPLAGKPPVLNPGQELAEKLPLIIYKQLPSAFSLVVDEIQI